MNFNNIHEMFSLVQNNDKHKKKICNENDFDLHRVNKPGSTKEINKIRQKKQRNVAPNQCGVTNFTDLKSTKM